MDLKLSFGISLASKGKWNSSRHQICSDASIELSHFKR